MKYYLILDDSGQLHINYPHSNYFVYGGLLMKEADFHGINASYRSMVRTVKREKGWTGELKTSDMDIPTRRRLLKKIRGYTADQVFVCVEVPSLLRIDFDSSRDINRYKNYILRRLMDKLIEDKKIPIECSHIEMHIDNQNVAHSAKNDLVKYLYDHYHAARYNNAGTTATLNAINCDFTVKYKDSATHYLVQAADLLANTQTHILKNPSLISLLQGTHIILKLPDNASY